MKTYTIRIFPNKEQKLELNKLSNVRNLLWNTLIKMEQTEYETNGKIIHNYELDKRITELRKTTNLSILNSKACQRVSKEIYSGYQSFFKLIMKDNKSKTPKIIENVNDFHTIVFNQSGWIIKDNVIIINKIPLKYKSHLNISELNIKEIRVKYKDNKWLCDICIEEEISYDKFITQENKILSIDLGITKLGTGVDNKGNVIILKNKSKKINQYFSKQINKVKSKLSKKNKGSKNYKKLNRLKKKLYRKKNSQIKQTLHIQSKKLMNMNYKTIVLGDLSVKKLMELDNNKYSKISKSFHHSNINMFLTMLKYKSHIFKTDIIKIDERHTTQLNSLTGKLFKNKIELKDRNVQLSDNVIIDRDLNSAINIMKRYYNNHLASMTEPLDHSNVIMNFNVCNNQPLTGKPIVL